MWNVSKLLRLYGFRLFNTAVYLYSLYLYRLYPRRLLLALHNHITTIGISKFSVRRKI